MNTKPATVLCAMVILAAAPPSSRAAEDRWQVGSAPSFSSGKYGTDSTTEVLHTPITARRLFRNGDLTLVFPFTCISGNGNVTVVNGTPVRSERLGNAASTTASAESTSGRPGGAVEPVRGIVAPTIPVAPPATLGPAPSACGMGDIVVRGRYYVLDERGWMPTIAIRAHVKTPSASVEQGLGTGRPDEGVGVEVSRTVGRGSTAMLDSGYTVMGQPGGVRFNNTWWYDVGFGQDVAGGVVNLSVFFEEYQAIVPGFVNARDVLAAVIVSRANGWRLQVSGQFGLSEGAPDHGVTLGASRRF